MLEEEEGEEEVSRTSTWDSSHFPVDNNRTLDVCLLLDMAIIVAACEKVCSWWLDTIAATRPNKKTHPATGSGHNNIDASLRGNT
jgi:hypothetical protein